VPQLPADRTASGTKAVAAHSLARAIAPTRRKQIMVRKTLEFAAIAGLLLMAACNTVAGAGKDVSSVGKTVTNTANDVK
jgi:predicted small secreted protein